MAFAARSRAGQDLMLEVSAMGHPTGKAKMKIAMRGFAGLCLGVWLSAGWMWAVAQDQPENGAPAPTQSAAPAAQDQPENGAPAPTQGSEPAAQDQQEQPENGPSAPTQGYEPAANIARLSFVQGGVQISSGGQVQFQQAVANMPVLEGAQLQTAEDGQAEVEFGDGSVARLTPNSSLQIDHLSADSVQIEQLSGLGYYELNTGQGHPSYQVVFSDGVVVPTSNAIFRVDLDDAPAVASMTGTESITSNGNQVGALNAGETFTFQPSGNSPYTVTQTIASNSWDQWNQDRDQAISQEASAQTDVRDDSGDGGSENWNDLDAYGDWYSVPDAGNVWVPAGVGAGWDPYGYGYWGFYPGLGGYVWISGYPWGWLPYHCGLWSYYSFGWGWSPGGCGRAWMPLSRVRGYGGYVVPRRPFWRPGYPHPILSSRLVIQDRGPAARGPWGMGHPVPVVDRGRTLNVNGRTISPIRRTPVAGRASIGSSFTARGTSPGVRSALQSSVHQQRGYRPGESVRSPYSQGPRPMQDVRPSQGPRPMQNMRPMQQNPTRPLPQYNRPQPQQRYNGQAGDRSGYVRRSMPTPHYSAPPRAYRAPSGGNRGGGGGHSGGGRGR